VNLGTWLIENPPTEFLGDLKFHVHPFASGRGFLIRENLPLYLLMKEKERLYSIDHA
jgi:hypothetical protein